MNTKITIEIEVEAEDMISADIIATTIIRSGCKACNEGRKFGKCVAKVEFTESRDISVET